MKNYNLALDSGDIKTLMFALNVFQNTDLSDFTNDVQDLINDSICTSVIQKLSSGQSTFLANDVRIIFSSLFLVDMIIKGELDLHDPVLLSHCCQYTFSINKLLPQFTSIVDRIDPL